MATKAVPGADKKNFDSLDVGCWAEDEDAQDPSVVGGSLVFIAGFENGQVVYQMYDLANGMFYQDAMLKKDFKSFFSVPPIGSSKVEWTWHDKTPFPWNRVMKRFTRPAPHHADVIEQLSAAERVAQDLNLRGRELEEQDISHNIDQDRTRGMAIIEAIAEAVGRVVRRE